MRGLSAAQWACHHAAERPRAPAVDGPRAALSYRALADAVLALAGDLRAAGLGPGGRAAVLLPHEPAAAVALLAVQAAGASAVPLDRALRDGPLAAVLARTRARHAIVASAEAARVAAAGPALARLWVLPEDGAPAVALRGPPTSRLDVHGAPLDGAAPLAAPVEVEAAAEALVLFTSGSTGEPRGVVQTFGNVAANTRSIVAYLGLAESDRALALLPLHYCYGLSVLQTHLAVGGSVFLEPRSMYPRLVLEAIAREGCTGLAGVPLTFELFRRDVDVAAVPRPRLRYLTQAGGRMAPETILWARAAFAPARLFVMYGQTEATARLAYVPPERGEEKLGSIGVPIPGVELRVVGADGRALPDGEVGELAARGENVTPGYLDAPEETRAVLRDGWLLTGDLGYRDRDGFFFLVGRAKEMLKIGGHRVSPAEIEEVVLRHPAVREAAVAGAPDPLAGEAAVAFVVRGAQGVTERELRAFCRERLPPWCVPAQVRFVPALPRSGAGKLLRAALARAAAGPVEVT